MKRINICDDGELDRWVSIRSFRIVQREGSRDVARNVEHDDLEAIPAVGYRARSARGTAFRQWATTHLFDLLARGLTLDREWIKARRTLGSNGASRSKDAMASDRACDLMQDVSRERSAAERGGKGDTVRLDAHIVAGLMESGYGR